MTGPGKAILPVTITVEHRCPRRCQTEFDLEGVNLRFTLGQMIRAAEGAHDEAHAAVPPERVYIHGRGLLVRAGEVPA